MLDSTAADPAGSVYQWAFSKKYFIAVLLLLKVANFLVCPCMPLCPVSSLKHRLSYGSRIHWSS